MLYFYYGWIVFKQVFINNETELKQQKQNLLKQYLIFLSRDM